MPHLAQMVVAVSASVPVYVGPEFKIVGSKRALGPARTAPSRITAAGRSSSQRATETRTTKNSAAPVVIHFTLSVSGRV